MSDTASCPIFLLIYYHLCYAIYSTFIEKIQGNIVPVKQKKALIVASDRLPRLCESSTREGIRTPDQLCVKQPLYL